MYTTYAESAGPSGAGGPTTTITMAIGDRVVIPTGDMGAGGDRLRTL